MSSLSTPVFNVSWHQKNLLENPFKIIRTLLTKISPEYSLEELMQTLKLQQFGHLMQRTDLPKTTLMLGRTKGGRKKETTENDTVR